MWIVTCVHMNNIAEFNTYEEAKTAYDAWVTSDKETLLQAGGLEKYEELSDSLYKYYLAEVKESS